MSEMKQNELSSCRLKELMKLKGITSEILENDLHVNYETIKKYLNGSRLIPIDKAFIISDKYDVSLDWLYGKDCPMDRHDVILNSIGALGKVFRFREKTVLCLDENGKPIKTTDTVLCVDKRFCDYLKDIQALDQFLRNPMFTNDDYNRKCKEIMTKHAETLKAVYDDDTFDENATRDILDPYALQVIDLLSSLIESD